MSRQQHTVSIRRGKALRYVSSGMPSRSLSSPTRVQPARRLFKPALIACRLSTIACALVQWVQSPPVSLTSIRRPPRRAYLHRRYLHRRSDGWFVPCNVASLDLEPETCTQHRIYSAMLGRLICGLGRCADETGSTMSGCSLERVSITGLRTPLWHARRAGPIFIRMCGTLAAGARRCGLLHPRVPRLTSGHQLRRHARRA